MEANVKHILVPTDLSDFATLALRYAKMLAERLQARVTLLHAADSTGAAALVEHPLGYYFENRPEEVVVLQKILREQAAQNGLVLDNADLVVVQNLPARAILETAKHRDVDMIVMGTHGRSGWRRAVLGSVTERVLHQAACPVLTVTPKRYKEIVGRGDVAMEVVRASDSLGADLIVLGAERRGFREETTFGANCYSILRNAGQAVLTVSRLQPRQARLARRLRASA